MLATAGDKKDCVNIIMACSREVPSIGWIAGKKGNRLRRIRALAGFMFDTALEKNGAFLSSNREGLVLFFKASEKGSRWKSAVRLIRLFFTCIGIFRIAGAIRRERYIQKHLPADPTYYNFWFFGIRPESRGTESGAAKELKDFIIREANWNQLPIYLQTSLLKNKKVYERYGFTVYHEWKIEKENLTMWFMKREPNWKRISAQAFQVEKEDVLSEPL